MWRRLIYHPEVNYALRQTIVLCLPVAIGLMFNSLQQGLLFSLVPACCNIAGLDQLHKRFFKRLAVGGSLFARQQKVIDQISQVYQQLHMLSANHLTQYKRLLRAFQVALDLQEHIAVNLHQPDEVQKLVQQSHAEAGIAL